MRRTSDALAGWLEQHPPGTTRTGDDLAGRIWRSPKIHPVCFVDFATKLPEFSPWVSSAWRMCQPRCRLGRTRAIHSQNWGRQKASHASAFVLLSGRSFSWPLVQSLRSQTLRCLASATARKRQGLRRHFSPWGRWPYPPRQKSSPRCLLGVSGPGWPSHPPQSRLGAPCWTARSRPLHRATMRNCCPRRETLVLLTPRLELAWHLAAFHPPVGSLQAPQLEVTRLWPALCVFWEQQRQRQRHQHHRRRASFRGHWRRTRRRRSPDRSRWTSPASVRSPWPGRWWRRRWCSWRCSRTASGPCWAGRCCERSGGPSPGRSDRGPWGSEGRGSGCPRERRWRCERCGHCALRVSPAESSEDEGHARHTEGGRHANSVQHARDGGKRRVEKGEGANKKRKKSEERTKKPNKKNIKRKIKRIRRKQLEKEGRKEVKK